MTDEIKNSLLQRNDKIIQDIIAKSNVLCPESIAMIGITGSFATGDFHEKSDLDLLIIINDNDGWKIAQCFILEDVAHDIYCHYWGQLEEMAEYTNPFVLKLLNVRFVYCADEKYMDRYMQLRKKLEDRLAQPLCEKDFEKINEHLCKALEDYGRIMLSEDIGDCRWWLNHMLHCINYCLYLLNKELVRHGVKNMPAEIAGFEKLPENYVSEWQKLIRRDNICDIQKGSAALIKSVKNFIEDEYRKVSPKKAISADDLNGSYEEIFSNWKNKMYNCAKNGDVNLSFDSMAACQEIYNDFYFEYDIEKNDLLKDFSAENLLGNAMAFDKAMERHLNLYKQTGLKVNKFSNLEEFEKSYLKDIL